MHRQTVILLIIFALNVVTAWAQSVDTTAAVSAQAAAEVVGDTSGTTDSLSITVNHPDSSISSPSDTAVRRHVVLVLPDTLTAQADSSDSLADSSRHLTEGYAPDDSASVTDTTGFAADSGHADSLRSVPDSLSVAQDSLAAGADSTVAEEPQFPFTLPELVPIHRGLFYRSETEFDWERGIAITREMIGGVPSGAALIQPIDSFIRSAAEDQVTTNLRQAQKQILSPTQVTDSNPILEMQYEMPNLPPMARSIIGEGPSTLRITGYGKITISGRSQYQSGQVVVGGTSQSKFPTLSMKQELSFQINGTIGSKVHVQIDQDTRRMTDLENNIRIRYEGEEDEIIKEVEIGNTNLSLSGPQFISGGMQHSGLFGIKARAQLGDLDLSVIASQQKSSVQKRTFRGGAQQTEVEIRDVDYVKRRFYFVDMSYRNQLDATFDQLRSKPSETEWTTFPGFAREIRSIEVYQGGGTDSDPLAIPGYAYYASLTDESGNDLTPAQMHVSETELEERKNSGDGSAVFQYWKELEAGVDYTWDLTTGNRFGILQFTRSRTASDPHVAVRIYYVDQNGNDRVFPDPEQHAQTEGENSLFLKLVVKQNTQPTDPTWDYELRNIYDLGARGLDRNDLELSVIDGSITTRPDRPVNSAQTYMQLLKLDQTGSGLVGDPDNQLDVNGAKVFYESGLLFVPYLEPFREIFEELGDAAEGEGYGGEEPVDIYDISNSTTLSGHARYIFIAKYSRASTRINLGFNILENSEVVKLNGAQLTKDVDYTIEYLTGELRFLPTVADQIAQPNADLTVDYEINPLFKPDQETLLGLRGVYRLGQQGQIGTTFMFNSERTSAQRVRVGEEPTTMAIAGADASYEFRPNWMTAALDALPLLTTDVPSSFRIEGEVAQSFPNLNTRGIAYIDDFEGSANVNSVAMYRRSWFRSSCPENPGISVNTTISEDQRGLMTWFNPVYSAHKTRTRDIWYNIDEDPNDPITDVMNLWFRPSGDESNSSESWGGIMTSFGVEGKDLQQTEALVIWLRAGTTPFLPSMPGYPANNEYDNFAGGEATLYIDLGTISENAYTAENEPEFTYSGWNDEDAIMNTLYVNEQWADGRGNNILDGSDDDLGEDVGLDGCPDEYEDGEGGCLPTPNTNGESDPNGDNWDYDFSSSIYGYSHINGTEGNGVESSALRRPDSEDLNGSSELDLQNNYYSYKISLSNLSDYYVPDSEQPSGFRQYRIPIKDLDLPMVNVIGTAPSFSSIQGMRIWVTGVQDTAAWLTFAGMDFVGNDWEVRPEEGQEFSVKTINKQELVGYTPPPGVEPETDPTTGQEQLENSLSLEFPEVGPGQTIRIVRDLVSSKDFTNYRRFRMFVHGPTRDVDYPDDHLAAFVRLGLDTTYYYELRVPRLYPGWDERNFIDVDLDSLTNLKLTLEGDIMGGVDTVSADGRMRIVAYERGTQRVMPSLGSIRKIQIGVQNLSDRFIRASDRTQPITVWFDEMRLEGVRNISGRAMRANAYLKLADLVSFSVSSTMQDIGFGSIQDKRGRTSDQNTFSLSMSRFRFDKFFPASWHLSLPLSINYSRSTSVPRLKPGSDIELVNQEDKDNERTSSNRLSADAQFSRTTRSRNLLANLTVDRLSFGASYEESRRVTPAAASRDSVQGVSYGGRFAYDLSPQTRKSVRLFSWLDPIAPDWISQAELEYLPSTLSFNTSAQFRSDSTRRLQEILGRDSTTVTVSKNFSMSETYRLMYRPFRSTNFNYNMTITRDLETIYAGDVDPWAVVRAASQALFRKGETQRTHRLSTSYSPTWPWFLSHSYSYSNSYSDDARAGLTGSSASKGGSYRVNSQRSYGVNSVTFRIKDIMNRLSGRGGGGRGRSRTPSSGTESSSGGVPVIGPIAQLISNHLDNPTGRLTYAVTYSGSQIPDSLRPGWKFQVFGIGSTPPIADNEDLGITGSGQINQTYNWSVSSGLSLPLSMRLRAKYTMKKTRRLSASLDTTRTEDCTFPDVTLNWDRLQDFPILNALAQRSNIQSGYSRNRLRNWAATSTIPERMKSQSTTHRFNPLFAWTVMWKNRLRTTVRSTYERKYVDQLVGTQGLDTTSTMTNTWSVTASAGYELQTSRGIRKPWGGVWRLDGNISLSLDATLGGTRSVELGGSVVTEGADVVKSDRINWSIKPRATYQFSRTFSGSAELEVGVANDRYLKRKTHTRGLSVTGEIRFN